jgi:hypothetical protein
VIRLPDASAFEVDWDSLAACFRQFTNAPADTRHADVAPALRFISRNMIEPLDVAAVVAAIQSDANELLIGATGQAKIHTGYQTVASRVWRYICQTFDFSV